MSVIWIGPDDIEVVDTLDVAPIYDIELSVSADENHIEWFDTSPQGSSKPRVKEGKALSNQKFDLDYTFEVDK
ncbi:hypothetical protein [Vibrio sinaloensis]|uniref:hypothetical protein n=1 Tax=Photobacterium sp. (strain ATCC 43367) TaxID=379097 RepID=UPI0035F0AB6B